MASFDFKISNLDLVKSKLASFRNSSVLKAAIEKAANDVLNDLARQMAVYPPPPSGSKYNRTYNLQGGWTGAKPEFQPIAGFSFKAQISNPVAYAKFVQGSGTQAAIHKNRWQTDQQILDSNEKQITETLEEAVQAAVDQTFN